MLIIAQVQAQTNLVTQGAADLAMNSGFDLASAGMRFEEVKVGPLGFPSFLPRVLGKYRLGKELIVIRVLT